MNIIPPYEEALAILESSTFICEDIDIWTPDRNLKMAHSVCCGLLTPLGERTSLMVELFVKDSPKTKEKHYKFSLFRRENIGNSRIYQLDVRITRKPIKHTHALSHEHIGRKRIEADPSWDSWQYDDVLRYFCSRSGVKFNPPPKNPDVIDLRGN